MDKNLLKIHDALGISQQHLGTNKLSLHLQPRLEELKIVDIDFEGKPFILISAAAQAWCKMKEAALVDQFPMEKEGCSKSTLAYLLN